MKNHRGLYLQLHKEHDADVINKLDHTPNKQGYIKRLVRDDIKNEKGDHDNDSDQAQTIF